MNPLERWGHPRPGTGALLREGVIREAVRDPALRRASESISPNDLAELRSLVLRECAPLLRQRAPNEGENGKGAP